MTTQLSKLDKAYSDIPARKMWVIVQKEPGFDVEYSRFIGDKHLTAVEATAAALEAIENQGARKWYRYFYLKNSITGTTIELTPK